MVLLDKLIFRRGSIPTLLQLHVVTWSEFKRIFAHISMLKGQFCAIFWQISQCATNQILFLQHPGKWLNTSPKLWIFLESLETGYFPAKQWANLKTVNFGLIFMVGDRTLLIGRQPSWIFRPRWSKRSQVIDLFQEIFSKTNWSIIFKLGTHYLFGEISWLKIVVYSRILCTEMASAYQQATSGGAPRPIDSWVAVLSHWVHRSLIKFRTCS